jgi:DNA replication and repair protein RecF
LLAQAELHAGLRGEWPVIALDDLASELDRTRQRRVLERLLDCGAQVFITGTQIPESVSEIDAPFRLFHVEHGVIRPQGERLAQS